MAQDETTNLSSPPAGGGQGAVKLIECPRDAMQGWKTDILTQKKVQYINSLLAVGFDTIDFGSFVSPKAIPQMKDTREVLKGLKLESTRSKLLAIIANKRGGNEASVFDEITYLGFPFSVSETFQQRNTNAGIRDALITVKELQEICTKRGKLLVVYLSMGFGNPYEDYYSEELVLDYADQLSKEGVTVISIADTVGVATAEQIKKMTAYLISALPDIEIGVHLHSTAQTRSDKVKAAYNAGCRRFDSALKGVGGCPMATDELVGNVATEWLIDVFGEEKLPNLNMAALRQSLTIANEIFTS